MTAGPGTVSRILWHFTGSPHAGKSQPKPQEDAYSALEGILRTKTLQATALESIKERSSAGEAVLVLEEKTVKVGCVAEIPIQHLDYHAERYGQFAIGFNRIELHKAGFRPVIYALVDDRLLITKLRSDERLRTLAKTIDQSELETTYAEREWRCTSDFAFEWAQVVMVVLPTNYREKLIKQLGSDLPRSVAIVAYEDPLKH